VVAKARIRQFIEYIHTEGKSTIILTTHDLSDVERLCERVMILDQGRLLYDGSLTALIERFEDKRSLVVTFAEDYADITLAGLTAPQREGKRAIYMFDSRHYSSSQLIEQLLQRFRIADLEVSRP
jgi:ABC-2 type transport system ATP-binding protein